MTEHKFAPKYLDVYNSHKGHGGHLPLEYIDEIYLPFWVCRQEIYVQTELKVDEFSAILLELVARGVKKRSDICAFLGVKTDDFCLSQLDYLINHGFLEEQVREDDTSYEITYEGQNFLKGESLPDSETVNAVEVEYSLSDLNFIAGEKYQVFYNDLTQEYFDKGTPFDEAGGHDFLGYKLIETHKLKKAKDFEHKHIPHKNKPTFAHIRDSNFIEFYNSTHDGVFYDFGKPKIEAHKRSIKFYILLFRDEADSTEQKIEIRHCKDSVIKFDKRSLTLENILSEETSDYITKDPKFLENLMNPDQSG